MLHYTPQEYGVRSLQPHWWALLVLNQRPFGYEPTALTPELKARTEEGIAPLPSYLETTYSDAPPMSGKWVCFGCGHTTVPLLQPPTSYEPT